MTLLQFINIWLDEHRTVKAAELKQYELRVTMVEKDIKAIDQQLRLLGKALEASDNQKLFNEVNDLKTHVAKLSSRMVGFAKSGIS